MRSHAAIATAAERVTTVDALWPSSGSRHRYARYLQDNSLFRFDANGMDDIMSPQMIRFELMRKFYGSIFEYKSDQYTPTVPA